jgi:hypothetical protein
VVWSKRGVASKTREIFLAYFPILKKYKFWEALILYFP